MEQTAAMSTLEFAALLGIRLGGASLSHVVLFGVIVAVAALLSRQASHKRQQELMAWAHAHGLEFCADRDGGMDSRFPWFGCLRRGHSRYACNIIQGAWGRYSFVGFDYHYTTGSGKNRQHHRFSAVILGCPMMLHPLVIRPEGFFDKVTEFFGYDDIDFESAEFSRRFFVKAPNKRWAYDVLHQRTMQFLLESPRFTLEMAGRQVMVYRSKRFSPRRFEDAAAVATGVLERLPEYVVRQLTAPDER